MCDLLCPTALQPLFLADMLLGNEGWLHTGMCAEGGRAKSGVCVASACAGRGRVRRVMGVAECGEAVWAQACTPLKRFS